MIQRKVFSVLALDLQGPQDWGAWMHDCAKLAQGIHLLLAPLDLKSEVTLTRDTDQGLKRFGISVSLRAGKQRDFLDPLESSLGLHSNYIDIEAQVVDKHIRSCLASVNQRLTNHSHSGGGKPTKDNIHGGLEMDVDQLTRICAKLAAKGEKAQVRDSRGAVWTADVHTRPLRVASDEPMVLTALPIMVGNNCADFLIESPRVAGLQVRSSTITGNWGPLFNPDWSDLLYAAMKGKQWLDITCAVVLHPSGFVKDLQLYGFEDWSVRERQAQA